MPTEQFIFFTNYEALYPEYLKNWEQNYKRDKLNIIWPLKGPNFLLNISKHF